MNLTDDAILSLVRGQLADMFGCPPGDIGPDTTAADVNGWDSLSHTHFLMKIERTFGIHFDPYSIGEIACIGDLVNEIARLSK